MAYPTSPSDGQIYGNKKFNITRNAWVDYIDQANKITSSTTTAATTTYLLGATSTTSATPVYNTSVYITPSTGQLTATSLNTTSSKDLKENIEEFITSGLRIINSVDVVSFNYISDEDKNYKVGFIAEDTDEILSTHNHNSMDIANCVGILIKAVQELSERLDILENK